MYPLVAAWEAPREWGAYVLCDFLSLPCMFWEDVLFCAEVKLEQETGP